MKRVNLGDDSTWMWWHQRKRTRILAIAIFGGLLAIYAYLYVKQQRDWREESMSIVKFNQIKYDEKQLAELRKRIDDTITTIELNGGDGHVRVERLHKIRGRNSDHDHNPIFPKEFYKGTMYGIVLDPRQITFSEGQNLIYEESLKDLRNAIEQKLAVHNIFPASFKLPSSFSAESHGAEVWKGFAVQFLHDPGGHNHDESDEWHVMWVCRLFNQLYAYKWQPHIWGAPFDADAYDPMDPTTFKHSTMIETIIPSNHAWKVLYSKVPVTSLEA